MGMFSYLFNRPDWYQKSKESKDGFISNFKPESRRYLNKEGQYQIDDTDEDDPLEMSVKSTAVQGYTYNPKNQTLSVQFVNGNKSYDYPNVPRDVVEDFGHAPSKGRFVHDVLKPEYSVNS